MPVYENQPCIVCGELFKPEDDVVSCPECGTPYHRTCWKQAGKCVNTALHESGKSWTELRREEEREAKHQARLEEDEALAAERERGESPQMFNAELYDGVRLNPEDPCIGLDPEEQMDGVTVSEAAAFIRSNQFYYLPLFRMMTRTGKKISFNLLGLLCPQLYFANRKMWGAALAAVLLRSVLSIPSLIVGMNQLMGITIPWADITTTAFNSVYRISTLLYFGVSLLCCLLGNYLYYRFALRNIRQIKKQTGANAALTGRLQYAGGTSLGNVFLILIIEFVIGFAAEFVLYVLR